MISFGSGEGDETYGVFELQILSRILLIDLLASFLIKMRFFCLVRLVNLLNFAKKLDLKGVVQSRSSRGYVEVDSLGETFLFILEQNRTKIDRAFSDGIFVVLIGRHIYILAKSDWLTVF